MAKACCDLPEQVCRFIYNTVMASFIFWEKARTQLCYTILANYQWESILFR